MIGFEIDDSQVIEFTRSSPKRAEWAMSEALKMAGGHFGTKKGGPDSLRTFMLNAGGLKPLHPVTLANPRRRGKSPLAVLAALVTFRYGKTKGVPRVQIGWIKKGLPAIARRALYGVRKRVTPQIRELFHRRGVHLKKSTKTITVPARPALDAFWAKTEKKIWPYVEKKFFEKFFSKQRANIRF